MSEYKYLSDGRKVVVIGQLNNIESIVQEIFITESGDQVPSGEKFTTKNLHDEPVESYKVKREKEFTKRLEDKEREVETISREIRRLNDDRKQMKEMFNSVKKLADKYGDAELEKLDRFMSGAFEWVVIENYYIEPPKPFNKAIRCEDSSSRSYDGIKLLSLFGRSDGDLEYRIGSYSDGSGSSHRIHAFETYDEALLKVKEIAMMKLEKGHISVDDVIKLKEMNIFLPMGVLKPLFEKKLEESNDNYEKSVKKSEDSHKKYIDNLLSAIQ